MENKENICIKCGQRPVFVEKRRLCKICCRRFYYKDKRPKEARIYHNSEIEFVKNFFKHKNWIYHPAIFRLNGVNYEPDFYDGERNVFIEVSGTRQAFQENFKKYKSFIEIYPHINFEIRDEQGHIKLLEKRKYKRRSQHGKVEALTT